MPTASDSLLSQVTPPGFALSDRLLHAVPGAEVVAIPVLRGDDDPLLGPGAADLADVIDVDLLGVLEVAGATGKAGEVTAYPLPDGSPHNLGLRQVLLVGVGSATPTDLRRAGAALARATRGRSVVATSIPGAGDDQGLETFVVGATLGAFAFSMKADAGEPPPASVVLAGVGVPDPSALDRGVALGLAGWRARTLATVPSNVKNPEWLADQARAVADRAGLECTVWDERALAKDGFGGILGVGQASATPPRLIQLDYTPARGGRRAPRVVLVGKGITFDSGGLSIKPAEGMVAMKRDMTGGAVVLAVLEALATLGCPLRVTGLVAAAENAISGSALRPGDVIRHYGGRTTEVTNTDAEGRLVMADALAYAVDRLDPAIIVDIATLTGAMKVALGQQLGGVFSNRDGLAADLVAAGLAADEPLWQFPLVDDYQEHLESPVADSDNARVGPPGAILAALFLRPFVGETPWAHLDIASVGDSPKDAHEWTSGPTGFGARVLLRWLTGPDPLKGALA